MRPSSADALATQKRHSVKKLEDLIYCLEVRVDELVDERKCLHNKAARISQLNGSSPDDRQKIRNQIDGINAKLQPLRLHLRDCKEVRERLLADMMATRDIAKILGNSRQSR